MSNTELSRAERLDHYVAKKFPALSRSSSSKLITENRVFVNGVVENKPGYKLRESDSIDIDFNEQELIEIPLIELPVVYEDKDCVVINKPVGLLSHSKGAFNPEPTVASWLASRVSGIQGDRAGVVHRLDRATSGIMICAKNESASKWLQKQFSTRKVKKTYIALVEGTLHDSHAIIDMPIERNPKKPQTFRAGYNGKSATTEYTVIKENSSLTMLELKPTTGRTHQLRVHLKQIGHPIIGDTLYESRPAERMFLHAKRLEITLPDRQRKKFTTPLPTSFDAFFNFK